MIGKASLHGWRDPQRLMEEDDKYSYFARINEAFTPEAPIRENQLTRPSASASEPEQLSLLSFFAAPEFSIHQNALLVQMAFASARLLGLVLFQ